MQSIANSRRDLSSRWRPLSLFVSLGVISWLAGTGVFAIAQYVLTPPQLRAAAFWSAVASLLLVPVAAMPALVDGDRRRSPRRRVLPLVCAACAFLPVTLLGGIWGSGQSPIALVPVGLACLMGLSVAAFAAGYAVTAGER